ncbi:MAG TPA: DUF2254 domain-containing protein [Dermatophilaceae bacterium]|nr:DUF2254 domain-containing protein [Dermatophilaceae bacterium]
MSDVVARLRGSFWLVPMACAVLAAGLAIGLTELDKAADTSFSLLFLFAGGPEGARAVLSAIITSMISFTGLVFSITVVVLQLTSSQFSPRVLRTFLRDRGNQLALGVFVATFVYALVVLRAVRGTADVDPFVPQVSVTTAFLFMLASVVVFLLFIHHIAQSIRAATIIDTIARDTRETLERRCPPDPEPAADLLPPTGAVTVVSASSPGVVQRLDEAALLRHADELSARVTVLRAVGEFAPAGAPLLEVRGEGAAPDDDRLRAAVHLGRERSMDQDVGFGLRQLVDIADRALSPGINDPSTAIQAIDQLHDLLRRLASRRLEPWSRRGEGGGSLVVPTPAFADYLHLAVDEVARWGADADRVQRRLSVMLQDLHDAALPEHRGVIGRALLRHGPGPGSDGAAGAATDIGLRSDGHEGLPARPP